MCLWNWAKSKHNNPKKNPWLSSCNSFNDFSNESDHSSEHWPQLVPLLYRVGMARGDKLNTFVTGNSRLRRLASWLCGDMHQDWCVFLTMAIYIERCSLAMWGEESLSRTISSRSMVLSPYQASTNYIQRNCPAFRLYRVVPHCITEPAWQQKQGEKDASLWDDKYCDKA